MRARLSRFAVVGVVALVGAAPAWASHSHPATYSGAFTDGGAVSFNVSADGNAVTRIMFTRNPVWVAEHQYRRRRADRRSRRQPIVREHHDRGTFPAPQVAQGSVRISGCSPSPASYSWSATTTAAPAVTPTPTSTPTVTPVA